MGANKKPPTGSGTGAIALDLLAVFNVAAIRSQIATGFVVTRAGFAVKGSAIQNSAIQASAIQQSGGHLDTSPKDGSRVLPQILRDNNAIFDRREVFGHRPE